MNDYTSDDRISAVSVEFYTAEIEGAEDVIAEIASSGRTVVFSKFTTGKKTDLLFCLQPSADKSIEKALRERAKKYSKTEDAVLVRVEGLGMSENAGEIALSVSDAPALGIWKSDVGVSVCFENKNAAQELS